MTERDRVELLTRAAQWGVLGPIAALCVRDAAILSVQTGQDARFLAERMLWVAARVASLRATTP